MPGRWRVGTTRLQSIVLEACWRPMTGDEAGDFHEVIDLKDGRVAIVVGDAPGYGPPAAAIADALRTELRRGFRASDDVPRIFAAADDQLQASGDEVIATAACALVDPAGGVVQVVNAGHPPLVLAGRESVELVDGEPDPPLGLGGARRARVRPLPPDAALFLYTDGLIERRGAGLDQALETLVSICEGLPMAGGTAIEFARRATSAFGPPTDDVTVLSAQVVPESPLNGPVAVGGEAGHVVVLRVYLDPRDLRSTRLRRAVDDLTLALRGHADVRVDVLDITAPTTDIEAAGVLATPTIVRADTRPPLRVIGWFRTADELAEALQLPSPKETR
ncbi:MAG: PP2C family protein-serine/threonine phosphatase [Acidimicrobiia bacterium]